MNINI
jgi:hypothetical protein